MRECGVGRWIGSGKSDRMCICVNIDNLNRKKIFAQPGVCFTWQQTTLE